MQYLKRLGEISRAHPLEVENRNQIVYARHSPPVSRKNRTAEPLLLQFCQLSIINPRLPDRQRTDPADDLSLLGGYKDELDATYELYFRVSRMFVRLIGSPGAMRLLTRTGLRNKTVMEWTLRVMANLMRPEDKGIGERVYDVIEKIVRVGPNP